MDISRIEFYEYSYEDYKIEFDEIKQCWKGYICFNLEHIFYFQINEDSYEIFLEPEEKGLNEYYKKLRKEVFEETFVNKNVQKTFQDLITFFNLMHQAKEIKKIDIEQNILEEETNDFQERLVQLKDFPLFFNFAWVTSYSAPELHVGLLPVTEDGEPYRFLYTNSLIKYFDETLLRKVWSKAIKDEKNRLRLMNYSLIEREENQYGD